MTGFASSIGGLFGRIAPSRQHPVRTACGQGGSSETGRPSRDAAPQSPPTRVGETADIVTAGELVAGIHQGEIRRVIVLSVDADRGHIGGIELVRRLTASGLSSVLIDLTPQGRVAEATGLGVDSAGFAAVADGLLPLTDVIHRDPLSRAHVVPSAGYTIRGADGAKLADLRLFLAAFAQAYECTVTEYDPEAIDRLPVLLDQETALVIAGSPGARTRSAELVEALHAVGIDDLLFMESRRSGPMQPR